MKVNGNSSVKDPEVPLLKKTNNHLRESNLRWMALAFACFTCIGDYYGSNLFTALQTVIKRDFDMGEDNTKYNLISSVGSFPGIFLPFIGGILIDRFGVRLVYITSGFTVIIGYIIITVGIAELHFTYLLIGKVVAAIGAGPLIVSKSAMLVKWFAGKELSLALGAALVVSRVASSLDSIISPRIYEFTLDLAFPFVIGVFVCVFAFIAICGLCYIDKKAETQDELLVEGATTAAPDDKGFNFRDVFKLPVIYFLIVLNVTIISPALFTFNANLGDLIVKRFNVPLVNAGELVPFTYYISFFLTPLTGIYVDRKGKRVLIIFLATIIFLISHLYIAFLDDAPKDQTDYKIIWGLVGIGFFYAAYSAVIWPCIALVVKKDLTGLAYGLTNSFQSVTTTIMPMVFAYVHDETKDYKFGYFWMEIVAVGAVALALIVIAAIYFLDHKNGGRLEKPGTQREVEIKKASRTASQADLLDC